MEKYLSGLFLQASLIFALGAQNLFVLESALHRRRHFLVSTICVLCDSILIMLGVLGAASVFVQYPWLKIIFGILGVGFLFYYGILKLFERPSLQVIKEDQGCLKNVFTTKSMIMKTLGFTLLNPHVYLDTLVLIGGYSAQYNKLQDRLIFGFGASSCSFLWFFMLSIFASKMNKYVNNLKIMRGINLISGIVLILLSCNLALDVWQWIIF